MHDGFDFIDYAAPFLPYRRIANATTANATPAASTRHLIPLFRCSFPEKFPGSFYREKNRNRFHRTAGLVWKGDGNENANILIVAGYKQAILKSSCSLYLA